MDFRRHVYERISDTESRVVKTAGGGGGGGGRAGGN